MKKGEENEKEMVETERYKDRKKRFDEKTLFIFNQ